METRLMSMGVPQRNGGDDPQLDGEKFKVVVVAKNKRPQRNHEEGGVRSGAKEGVHQTLQGNTERCRREIETESRRHCQGGRRREASKSSARTGQRREGTRVGSSDGAHGRTQ